MNDLLSNNSFRRYKDLEQQVYVDDLRSEAWNETVNLDGFFRRVENVKDDMGALEKLYYHLEEANKESKQVHDAESMKGLRSRMDSDVEKVLKLAKVIKEKLEALELSNADQRRLSGCGPGSSSDRTRTSVLNGLAKKLKVMMNEFQGLRARIASEYKETVGRRYFTITGEKANDEMIENLIASGEGETLVQRAIQEQGRGQILDTIEEIQERHDAVKEIERRLIDLHQVFLDMAVLVDAQGQQLNDIESQVARASSFVRRGTVQIEKAKEYKKSSRKCICIGVVLAICLVIILLLPILIHNKSKRI